MNPATSDRRFRLDDFTRTHLSAYADGYRAGLLWLATGPAKVEVSAVGHIHEQLHDGGVSGNDVLHLDADDYPTFIPFLKDTPYEREVVDGVEEMAEINRRQGTNFRPWPKRCISVSFDETYVLGYAAAVSAAIAMGMR